MNFKNIELSFQSVLDYYINQQQISCRIIKMKVLGIEKNKIFWNELIGFLIK